MEAIQNITVEPLLDAKEVKRLLRCSLPLVYKMANQGRLPCVRWECLGRGDRAKTMVRFKLTDILEFVEANYQKRT